MIVTKRISFDAAHYLPYYKGKCRHMHGHRWMVELGIEGLPHQHDPHSDDNELGMVMDFSVLNKFLKAVKRKFDHKVVNKTIPNPTAENMALYICEMWLKWRKSGLGPNHYLGVKMAWVKVWETPDSCAILGVEV